MGRRAAQGRHEVRLIGKGPDRRIGRSVLVVLLLIFTAMFFPAFTTPSIIYVPDDYPTIQAAVDAASPGDTIIVRDGTYTENVDVNKDHLTIKSENGVEATIVQAADTNHNVFNLDADYVTIDGFTVKGATGNDIGGIVIRGNYCNISGNKIIDNYYGILLLSSSNNVVTNNIIEDNNVFGVGLFSSGENSISSNTFINDGLFFHGFTYRDTIENNTVNGKPLVYLHGVSNSTVTDAGQVILARCRDITIENLSLSNTSVGIELWQTEHSIVKNNNVSNNKCCGIYLWDSDDNILVNNIASSNEQYGIMLFSSDRNEIINNTTNSNNYAGIFLDSSVHYDPSRDNKIRDNIVNSNNQYGIQLYSSNYTILTNNVVSNNDCGVYLSCSNNNTFISNILSNNKNYGIKLDWYFVPYYNILYLNNFINNDNVYSSFPTNTWNSPDKVTYIYKGNTYTDYLGNYWSDYTGSDADGDGIGDTSYSINSDQDNYPLMGPFENYGVAKPICSFPQKGDCQLPPGTTVIGENEVTGIEEGDLYIPSDATLHLNPNATFIWNPGYSIVVDGSITKDSGAEIKKGYLCVKYNEQASCWFNPTFSDSPACPSGYMRWKDVLVGTPRCSNATLTIRGKATLEEASDHSGIHILLDKNGKTANRVAETTTGADGSYIFSNIDLPSGNDFYGIWATKDGYSTDWARVEIVNGTTARVENLILHTQKTVSFDWVYQPNGTRNLSSKDLPSGVVTLHSAVWGLGGDSSCGFIFSTASTTYQVADIYFLDERSYPYSFWANNGSGGIHDMGAVSLESISECPLPGPGVYNREKTDVVVGHTYCILTRDASHYAKIHVTGTSQPPALIQDFSASDGEDSQSTLTWTNSADSDLAQVVVRRKTGSYPADHQDGTLVYQDTSPTPGASATHIDTGLTNGNTYYYAVFSQDAAGNWNEQVMAGKNADTGTPGLENHPPIAKASDISGQPQAMYPDTVYTVTAKYFDPDGRADLKYCYLRLNHPAKPLTMMWYQADGHAAPWTGEEGENYLTITHVDVTEITDTNGDEGYQITWSFQINNKWPEVQNTIDFGVFASDDEELTSGWDYKDTNASFYTNTTSIENLERVIDELVAQFSNFTSPGTIKDQLDNLESYSYFSGSLKKDEIETVVNFAVNALSLIVMGLTPVAETIHFKNTSILSVSDEIRFATNHPELYKMLESIGGIDVLGKAFIVLTGEDLKTALKLGLKEEGEKAMYSIFEGSDTQQLNGALRAGLAGVDKQTFESQLIQFFDGEKGQIKELANEAKRRAWSLPPEQAQAYIVELNELYQGNNSLFDLYDKKTRLVKEIKEIKRYDEHDWKLKLARFLWHGSVALLEVAVSLTPAGFLGAAAIAGIEGVREQFFENRQKMSADAQMAGLALDALNDGSTLAYTIYKNTQQALEDIKKGNHPCVPKASFLISNEKIQREFELWHEHVLFYGPAEEFSWVTVTPESEECKDVKYLATVFYTAPYTSFKLFDAIKRTYKNMLPVERQVIVQDNLAKFQYYVPPNNDLTFYLFGKIGRRLYGLGYRYEGNPQWTTVSKEESKDYYDDFIASRIKEKDYESLSVYYDEKTGKIESLPTQVAEIKSMRGTPLSAPLSDLSTQAVEIKSPGELRVYDSQGKVVGSVNGNIKQDIPGSVYSKKYKFVVIFNATGSYRYEVVGTDNGTYGLDITSIENGKATTFTATDIPIAKKAAHQYTINWDALSQDKKGATVRIDSDGDGTFERTITADNELTQEEYLSTIPSAIAYVIAHWDVDNNQLDVSLPNIIDLDQILLAISWWANDTPVPLINQTINLDKILKLIAFWANDTPITETTTEASKLTSATSDLRTTAAASQRLISTPVVKPGNSFKVTVNIEAKENLNGLGLDEDLPDGWKITPLENNGATFKASEAQWVWLQVKAGETKQVSYEVHVPKDAEIGVKTIEGTISSRLPNFDNKVTGETEIEIEEAEELRIDGIKNIPNPVTNTDTTRFAVEGQGIKEIDVEIYDLSGKRVFNSGWVENDFAWHLQNDNGRLVANGVYLYIVTVKGFNGDTIRSRVRKLVILR